MDLSYIAAMIDGEGCICLIRKAPKSIRHEATYNPHLHICNTNTKLVTWLLEVTKIGNVRRQSEATITSKVVWVWELRREEIEWFLPQIKKYLKLKDEQAHLLLEFLSLPTFQFSRVPEHISIQRQLIWDDLRDLNKKGPT